MPQRKARKDLPRIGTESVERSHRTHYRAMVVSVDEETGKVAAIVGHR